jgi:TldD protein
MTWPELPPAARDFLGAASSSGAWREVFLEAGARFEARLERGVRTAGFHPGDGVALRERRPDGTTFAHTNALSAAAVDRLVADFGPEPAAGRDAAEPPVEATPGPAERRATRDEADRLADAVERAAAESGAAEVRLRFSRQWRVMRVASSDGLTGTSASVHTLVRVDLRHGDGAGWARRALGPAEPVLPADAGPRLVAAAIADADGAGPAAAPPSGAYPVVFAPSEAGLLVHEAIGHPLEADTALAGSALWGRRDRRFAGAPLDVAEDPSSAEAWVPAVVDEEGSPCRPVRLVAGGIVCDVVSDRETAAALGRPPTGHARRGAYSSPPMPRVRHTVVAAGADGDLVAGTGDGILVERISAADADPVRGTFTVRVERGRHLRAGRPAAPLADFTVRGDLDDFASLDGIGGSCEVGQAICGRAGHWLPISYVSPALRFGRLAVFGR